MDLIIPPWRKNQLLDFYAMALFGNLKFRTCRPDLYEKSLITSKIKYKFMQYCFLECDAISRTLKAFKNFNFQFPGIILILEPYTVLPQTRVMGSFFESSQ